MIIIFVICFWSEQSSWLWSITTDSIHQDDGVNQYHDDDYDDAQAEEPGGSEGEEGSKDLGDGHGAEGAHTGDHHDANYDYGDYDDGDYDNDDYDNDSACINKILPWGLEDKRHYNDKKTFREKWGLNEDLF